MTTEYLTGIIVRDLRAFRRTVEAFPRDEDLWAVPAGITNPAGALALHAAGNLRHFIGAQLGGTGYVRDRDAEFSRRGVPRAEVLADLDAAIAEVGATLPPVDAERLLAPFPTPVGGVRVATLDFLIHLTAHLAYHLGQADYHRRLVTGTNETVGAQGMGELRSAVRSTAG